MLVSPSAVRSPRVRVIANGIPLIGVTGADVLSTNHYAADRFSVDIALGADPQLGPGDKLVVEFYYPGEQTGAR